MKFSSSDILATAASTGFRPDMVEKVFQLMNLLNTLNLHPYLKNKWVLKGGTALNIFLLDLPRLSVDIDLNYIGEIDSKRMLSERPKIEQALQAVFSRESLLVKRVPNEHAGGKWRLSYQTFTGQTGNLEVDLNFMLRIPLWDIGFSDSHFLGNYQIKKIPVLDPHELIVGKLAALLARKQARDLFDSFRVFKLPFLDLEKIRLGFVVYGAMNRKDWRNVSLDDVDFDEKELIRQLLPTLHHQKVSDRENPLEYATKLVLECKKALSMILPLREAEILFLDLLLDRGIINPKVLTPDEKLQSRIIQQPLLQWKAKNVRHFKCISEEK